MHDFADKIWKAGKNFHWNMELAYPKIYPTWRLGNGVKHPARIYCYDELHFDIIHSSKAI